MQKRITTFLTFNDQAEEAMNFYDEDPEKARRVMEAMLQMSKIEIDGLRRAYELAEASA